MTGGWISLALFLLPQISTAGTGLVVNELYYDHPGADAGYEFVELLNASGADAALDGLTLEFHNGSGTGWTVVWRLDTPVTLANDALFVIGGASVSPAPDVTVALALQNGPDAVRIVAGDGTVLDVVGYGGLDDPAYVETLGAAPVSAGQSIARTPDGTDTGDNALDFLPADPTPGRFNVARYDVAIALAAGTPAREALDGPGDAHLAVELVSLGIADVAAASVSVSVRDSTTTTTSVAATAHNTGVIVPGGVERVPLAVTVGAGYHWLVIDAHHALDERSGNDRVTAVRRAGRIPVLVSEVWSAPRDGCPQFVELYNAGAGPVDVTGWSLRDTRGRPVTLAVDSLVLEARGFLAVTSSPSALVACVPGAPASRVVGVDGSWPAFNRSGSDVADSVVVYDARGIGVDAVAYPPLPSGTSGRSLERIDLYDGTRVAVWRLSPAPGGCTPGTRNDASLYAIPPRGTLAVAPNPFSPWSGELLRIAVDDDAVVARVALCVFDVDGRRVIAIGSARALPAVFLWDGRDDGGARVRPGLYVLACEEFLADGARYAVLKAVVGCAPPAR